jgi:hypothetical protein
MPEIMIEPAVREAFACFLERLSEKDSNLAGDLLALLSRAGILQNFLADSAPPTPPPARPSAPRQVTEPVRVWRADHFGRQPAIEGSGWSA